MIVSSQNYEGIIKNICQSPISQLFLYSFHFIQSGRQNIKDFLQKHTFNFQIASLPQEKINAIKKISFYPFTVIVTKKEKIFFGLFGKPLGKNSAEEIFNLLDKQMEKAITQ